MNGKGTPLSWQKAKESKSINGEQIQQAISIQKTSIFANNFRFVKQAFIKKIETTPGPWTDPCSNEARRLTV